MQSYLEAKRTVDDRALNRRVLDRFTDELAAREDPVQIVELGAGVGTMIVRLAEWGLFPEQVYYRAVDHDPANIDRARELVSKELDATGYDVSWRENDDGRVSIDSTDRGPRTLVATRTPRQKKRAGSSDEGGRQRLEITFDVADALSCDPSSRGGDVTADAVITAAFLDLVDLADAMPAIELLLDDDGLLYAPITFDAGTGFAPQDSLDDRIERRYHHHMETIRDGGRSNAGRELLATLPDRGWNVLEAGGSDWIVRPIDDRDFEDAPGDRFDHYPADERMVVAHVLETLEDALADIPANPADERTIGSDGQARWLERRRRELDRGELVFVANNIDVLGRYS